MLDLILVTKCRSFFLVIYPDHLPCLSLYLDFSVSLFVHFSLDLPESDRFNGAF